MWAGLKLALQGGGENRRGILCVVLVAALLYNPFLTVLSNSLDLGLHQHPSYRATVASSELGRCTLETEKPVIPALVAVLFSLISAFAVSFEVSFTHFSDVVPPTVTACSDGIWFRPPPTTYA